MVVTSAVHTRTHTHRRFTIHSRQLIDDSLADPTPLHRQQMLLQFPFKLVGRQVRASEALCTVGHCKLTRLSVEIGACLPRVESREWLAGQRCA